MQLFSRTRSYLLFATITLSSKPLRSKTFAFHSLQVLPTSNNKFNIISTTQKVHRHISHIRGGDSGYSGDTKISGNHKSSLIKLFSSSSYSGGVNGENNKPKKEQKQVNLEGKTGWNHNLPKESSSFWNLSSGDKASSSGNSSDKEDKPRTGWLHTKPKSPTTIDSSESESSSSSLSKALQLLNEAKMRQKINHRIVSPPTFHACEEGRRAVITEHFISVPLRYYNEDGVKIDDSETIDVYFSIIDLITSTDDEKFFLGLQKTDSGRSSSQSKLTRVNEQQNRASAYKKFINMKNADQCILYLQGGPGFGAPQPINGIGLGSKSSWVGAALGKGYKRVVLMDQRGTGR